MPFRHAKHEEIRFSNAIYVSLHPLGFAIRPLALDGSLQPGSRARRPQPVKESAKPSGVGRRRSMNSDLVEDGLEII